MNLSFAQAKAEQARLDAIFRAASDQLNAIPGINGGPMGLTPDSVKVTPQYRTAKTASAKAFADLRAFNGVYVKAFKKELTAERTARNAEREKNFAKSA